MSFSLGQEFRTPLTDQGGQVTLPWQKRFASAIVLSLVNSLLAVLDMSLLIRGGNDTSLGIQRAGAPGLLFGNGGGADATRADIRLVDTVSAPKMLLFWGGEPGNSFRMGVFRVQAEVQQFTGQLNFENVPIYADNASAIGGGLAAGDVYRTGADPDPVCIVH